MLSPTIARRLAGMWQIVGSEGTPECEGFEVRPSGRGRFDASYLLWKPGRLGCSTRSSDIIRVELDSRSRAEDSESDDSESKNSKSHSEGTVALRGFVPRMSGDDDPVEMTVHAGEGAVPTARLTRQQGTRDVNLVYLEIEPSFDLTPE